ncbi:Putative protein of unknown function [Podospora comata]|uniref:Uncharacterized protein n=1 Tax=Podospora comata TaxID=48703 RepID=A0ABY6SH41_PODCO|nr:Putative protein of unknown function [Podospora comata]
MTDNVTRIPSSLWRGTSTAGLDFLAVEAQQLQLHSTAHWLCKCSYLLSCSQVIKPNTRRARAPEVRYPLWNPGLLLDD